MASRPTHIRVARLGFLLGCDPATSWRRSKLGLYGPMTRDDAGRLQVELSVVESAEGRVFDDADIARAVSTPSHHSKHVAAKAERVQSIWPGPMEIKTGQVAFFTPQEAADFAAACIEHRDMQWRIAIANAPYLRHR